MALATGAAAAWPVKNWTMGPPPLAMATMAVALDLGSEVLTAETRTTTPAGPCQRPSPASEGAGEKTVMALMVWAVPSIMKSDCPVRSSTAPLFALSTRMTAILELAGPVSLTRAMRALLESPMFVTLTILSVKFVIGGTEPWRRIWTRLPLRLPQTPLALAPGPLTLAAKA